MNKLIQNIHIAIILPIIFSITIVHAAFQTPHFKQKGVLGVCSYSEFKPIIYGQGEGYEADLLRAIAAQWKIKIKFYPEPVYEGIWRLPSRAYTLCDVSAGGMTRADYRLKEGVIFSRETMRFAQSLLVRKKDYASGRIRSYASFKDSSLKIGVVPGTTGELYAHYRAGENGLPHTVFVQYASESQLLPALLNGEIDAVARGEIGNEYRAEIDKNLITIDKKNFNEGFAFAVDANNKPLLIALNQAISEFTENGKLNYEAWTKNHNLFMQRVKK